MIEPWFDANHWAWLPGTALGVIGGTLGPLAGTLAPRGKAKGLVLGAFWSMIVVCGGLLATGLFALVNGQPYGVWYGLLLPGLIGTVVFGTLLPVLRMRYREAEQRRMTAQDLTP